MVFADYLEEILNTVPKDRVAYLQMNKILAKTLSDNIGAFVKSKENGADISTRNIKVKVNETKPHQENVAIYSNINYQRTHSYIEFYNELTKRSVRILLSTTGQRSFVVGFYINYTKNKNNNQFCKESSSVNEFFTSVNMLNTSNFIAQVSNFLLALSDSPFEEQAKNALSELH